MREANIFKALKILSSRHMPYLTAFAGIELQIMIVYHRTFHSAILGRKYELQV